MKKCLKNVFISNGGNDLKLVDICFEEKILEIIPRYDKTVSWDNLDTVIKKQQFIKQISPPPIVESDDIIDGRLMLAIPGAIDAHVHFNTPGFEEREDFEHGSLAAAFGGVTTVVDMPCTSLPPVTSVENLTNKLNSLKNRSVIDYAFWGGVPGNDFNSGIDIYSQVRELIAAGVAGFKVYMISGMDTFRDLTDDLLLETAGLIKKVNGIMAVHAEDKSLVTDRSKQFIEEGKNDWRAYCAARDVEAETTAVRKLIDIGAKTSCRIHVVHLSSSSALKLIQNAQEKGINITTETCPHYLQFTQTDFDNPNISAYLKTAPPVKFAQDKDALWEGLRDGSISFVTTDHAGCDPTKEKSGDNFWKIYGGIPGVEHRVPFLFSEGLNKRNLTISKIIDLLSSNAAELFNLSSKGSLDINKDSDITLIDLWNGTDITSQRMHAKGKYTPFEGLKLNAHVAKTILRGKIIMDQTRPVSADYSSGKFVKCNQN